MVSHQLRLLSTLFVCIASLASFSIASTLQQHSPRTLVLIDDINTKNSHSDFFTDLTARGHRVTIAHVRDDTAALKTYGVRNFDNLVIFAPSAQDLGEFIRPDDVVNFVNEGHSLLMAVNGAITEPIRMIANEFNVEFMESQSDVLDHTHFNSLEVTDSGKHSNIISNQYAKSVPSILTPTSKGVLFEGIGLFKNDKTASSIPLLYGNPTTYSVDPVDKDAPTLFGQNVVLVTAVQTPNNARAIFAGSLRMFSNEAFSASVQEPSSTSTDTTANRQFCGDVSKWVFHERGLLRVKNYSHYLVSSGTKTTGVNTNTTVGPKTYRMKDEIAFRMAVEEWTTISSSTSLTAPEGKWVPYNTEDMQLEFVMIDPYVRAALKRVGQGEYLTTFTVPDTMGIFKFVVKFHKLGNKGTSNLDLSQIVSVRPFRHDEFERFLWVATPYYLGTASIMTAFVLFCSLFLYSK